MGQKITNTFFEGLKRDLAISKQQNNSLTRALNIDLIADNGNTTGIITNHRGNKYFFNIPDTYSITKITLDKIITTPGVFTITLGTNTQSLNITTNSSIKDIYNQLIIAFNTEISGNVVKIQSNNEYIYVIGMQINPVLSTTSPDLNITNDYVPSQQNLSIIGWGTLDESLILFTTRSTNIFPNPTNTVGQIWKIDYDDSSETVISNFIPNTVNVVDHLIYNDYLNFSRYNEIYREVIGRKESSKIGNVYWTDFYNSPRVINVFNPNTFVIPPALLDWKPDFKLSIPILKRILPGGSLPIGSIQIAYRLRSIDGAVTQYSPLSNPVSLTDSFLNYPYHLYKGNIADGSNNSGKAATYVIDEIDTRFDIIEIVLVETEVKDVPLIYMVMEVPITGKKMEFTITGNESKVPIDTSSFVNPKIYFDVCKTFTQKKDRLYPANTKTKYFDVDWDARAYRFPAGSTTTHLYKKDGTYDVLNGGTYDIGGNPVPDEHDCVNPYNDESGTVYGLFPLQTPTTWETSQHFKYQYNSFILGGSGPNVSYKFVVKELLGDFHDTTPQAPNNGAVSSGGYPYTPLNGPLPYGGGNVGCGVYLPGKNGFLNVTSGPGIDNLGIDGQDYLLEHYRNNKSSSRASLYKTWARGEVYRFGIVFYNNKGQQSFVKWIGDIRIPEAQDDPEFKLARYQPITSSSGTTYLRTIGIEFEINTTNLPSDITGWEIVYIERRDEDKTRFGTGVHYPVLPFTGAKYTNGSWSQWAGNLNINNTETKVYALGYHKCKKGGAVLAEDIYMELTGTGLGGFPGGMAQISGIGEMHLSATDNTSARSYVKTDYFALNPTIGIIKSPIIDFDKYNYEATYIKCHEQFTQLESMYLYRDSFYSNTLPDSESNAWWVKHYDSQAYPVYKRNNIIYQDIVPIGGVVPKSAVNNPAMLYDFHNVCVIDITNGLSGIGNKLLFISHPDSTVERIDGLNYTAPNSAPNSEGWNNCDPGRLIQFCRYNYGQYGGPWRISRYNNVYISCGSVQPIDIINTPVQQTQVFGDSFVNYYDTVYYQWHWDGTYGVPTREAGSGLTGMYGADTRMKAVAIAFACESPINTDLRHGKYWSADQLENTVNAWETQPYNDAAIAQYATFMFDEFKYNDAYNQTNNIKKFLSKPFNFREDKEQRNYVWVSRRKIDRENVDSWRIYGVNDFLPLEGIYGGVNKIVNFNEMILAYQDRAVAQVSSEELSTIPNGEGQVLQAGTGAVLSRYDYISKDTGAFHQNAVLQTASSVYHFDVRLKKLFRFSNGLTPISDTNNLSTYFRNVINGNIVDIDRVLLNIGIHSVYDSKYLKAYYTFLTSTIINYTSTTQITSDVLQVNNYSSNIDNFYEMFNEEPFIIIEQLTFKGIYQVIESTNNYFRIRLIEGSFLPFINSNSLPINISITIAFNEQLEKFESNYSFFPHLYLNTGKKLFSVDTYYYTGTNLKIDNRVYIHNSGDYGVFYDRPPHKSEFEFIVKIPDGSNSITGRLDYLEYWGNVFDNNNVDYVNETLDNLRISNDYQLCTLHEPLLIPSGATRRERTWRINLLRDNTNPNIKHLPYLRDKYFRIRANYLNANNHRLLINDWNSYVTISAH